MKRNRTSTKRTAGTAGTVSAVYAAINVFLVALIFGMYFLLSGTASVTAGSRGVIYRGDVSSKKVALQFVVSWNAPAVADIMRVLQENNAKATFFVTGEWASENADTLCDMKELGHEIGTLGMETTYLKGGVNAKTLKESLARSIDIIENACETRAKLYYCADTPTNIALTAARGLNLNVVQCTIDLQCARGTAQDIVARAKKLSGGYIAVLTPTAQCALALPQILSDIAALGFTPATTSDISATKKGI